MEYLSPDTNPNFYTLLNLKKYLIKDKKINIENFKNLKKK